MAIGEVDAANAALGSAEAALAQTILTAPIDGQILSVDLKIGDIVSFLQTNTPSVAIGNINILHVSVEINESEVPRFQAGASAQAFIRGVNSTPIPLRFVSLDPVMKSKTNFANANRERVDMRVLEVTYAIAQASTQAGAMAIYPGQLLDVYIEAGQPDNVDYAPTIRAMEPVAFQEAVNPQAPVGTQATSYAAPKRPQGAAQKLR